MDIFAYPVSSVVSACCQVIIYGERSQGQTVAGTKVVWERPAHDDLLSRGVK